MSEPSVFTRILRGEIPAEILSETENVFVIRDIAPQAPLHLLVIPKTAEYRDVTELAAGPPAGGAPPHCSSPKARAISSLRTARW